eukprot:1307268-Ditylum_brightwellii.AAC.1
MYPYSNIDQDVELLKCDIPWVVPVTNVIKPVIGSSSMQTYIEKQGKHTCDWFNHICDWYHPWDITFQKLHILINI